MIKAPKGFHFPFHVRREAVTLTLLSGLAIVLFIGVTALSRLFHAQQSVLSQRWSTRGFTDLNAGNFKAAASEFHSALRYSEDSYSQQLGLAEALMGMKRINEASVYLTNLWEQQPENGIVNRELARIAAGKGDTRRALRYYHNAIYANWTTNPDTERVNTRWELIKYLLSIDSKAQAQSELISLAADMGADPSQQTNLGDYFLQVDDSEHALAAFRITLASRPREPEALAGAGTAAFNMGDYRLAERYLQRAVAESPSNGEAAERLQTAEHVLHMNPFRRQTSDAERWRTIAANFETAGARLKACPAVADRPGPSGPQQNMLGAWNDMKPHVTAREMRNDPDIGNQAMELVFDIEKDAAAKCGPGTPSDAALLLISKMHEGS